MRLIRLYRIENNFRLILYCIIVALLILFGTYNNFFSYVAALLMMIYMGSSSEDDFVTMMMFIMPMANIFKPSAGSASLMTYIELLFVVICIYKRKWKLNNNSKLILVFAFYVVFLQLLHGGLDITTTIKIIVYLLILNFACEAELNRVYKKLFFAFIFGVIVSSIMRYADSNVFRISEIIKMKEEHVGYGIYETRFSGLYGDPNYYVINVIISAMLVIVLLRKNDISTLGSGIIMLPLVYFCAITRSKSALLMLAIVLMFLVLTYFERRQYFLTFLAVIIGATLVVFVVSGYISIFSGTLDRFSRTSESSFGVTSNRTEIWTFFIKYIFERIDVLIFGRSMLFYMLEGRVTHNTYIDILYELGIIGGLLLIKILYDIFSKNNTSNNEKRTIINYSLLICIVIMYAFLSELQYFDPPFHLLLCYYVLNLSFKKEQVSFVNLQL